jgi:hypothetical protein
LVDHLTVTAQIALLAHQLVKAGQLIGCAGSDEISIARTQ